MRWYGMIVAMVAAVGMLGGEARGVGVTVSTPADQAVVCAGSLTISGTIEYDAVANYQRDRYEYRAVGDPNWTTIGNYTLLPAGAGAASYTGVLTNWNVGALASGWYYLRATLTTAVGTVTAATSVYIDHAAPAVVWTTPGNNAVVRGMVAIRGSASDAAGGVVSSVVEYKLAAAATYSAGLAGIEGELGRWNTVGLADGNYTVRVTVTDGCGNATVYTRPMIVDNTPPTVVITSPIARATTPYGSVAFTGTVTDAHIDQWVMQGYGGVWATYASGTANVSSGSLGSVVYFPAAAGANWVHRVRATDTAQDMNGDPNVTERYIGLDVRCKGDHSRDGVVQVTDIFDFLNDWFGACP